MARVVNFNAGPAALPLAALEQARDELIDFEGTGMSLLEHSHREAPYEKVHREAIALLRRMLSVPETHDILLMQGGARGQFAIVPMNLLHAGKSADYVVTGTWAKQAHEEAVLFGNMAGAKARVVVSTEKDKKFARIPTKDELAFDPSAAYVHITSNNTLFGTQWQSYPETGDVPLVADMTSDLLSRPIDVSKFGLIYAGAQKNVGPSGVTVVIARKDLIAGGRTDIPQIFRYKSFADSESLFNTPPTFAIYVMRNTLRVLEEQGGIEALTRENAAKAKLLYDTIDASPDFWRAPVEKASRSIMNVVWRLPTEELEKKFLGEAKAASLVGLKGHRSVGGVRASIYNAVRLADVEKLVAFMREFEKKNG
ncbi:3-phosphoserine/phosphohydroxythreonine transaminase [Sandaracinus amylolyticus]|uniref:Phosphoserine aminotransferase n=1 Tax=Sandaracinus amylolyticus TaxID=927083 RepID=A0A0F6WAH6_9BACT|nr:3-phosphoserine/phosphohydroxythreonine transaminase [Sandaracinus amylolyticus]AKF11508.1 Phosphoserine aminotransferase [Sandaracinus amylolyticus]